ncbi:MAG: metal-sulfur cluster assembly factor [Dehalococcoidia bacterium]|nr:metal-sulfur cluster assembly factor [Dehalococcoidia bacterium]
MTEVKTADVAQALRQVFDPELGIDIISLGLVYDIHPEERDGTEEIQVAVTTTQKSCPMGPAIFDMAETVLQHKYPDASVVVNAVFEPPWNVGMLTAEARRWLGLDRD